MKPLARCRDYLHKDQTESVLSVLFVSSLCALSLKFEKSVAWCRLLVLKVLLYSNLPNNQPFLGCVFPVSIFSVVSSVSHCSIEREWSVGLCKGLTMDQVDALWNCLAVDPLSSDDCLNWFLTTAKSKDYHALSINTLRHIFVDKVRCVHCVCQLVFVGLFRGWCLVMLGHWQILLSFWGLS